MRFVVIVAAGLILASCGKVRVETSSGLCEGLRQPIDRLADALVNNAEKTPEPVIQAGGEVIFGYDGGCSG